MWNQHKEWTVNQLDFCGYENITDYLVSEAGNENKLRIAGGGSDEKDNGESMARDRWYNWWADGGEWGAWTIKRRRRWKYSRAIEK
jgi:hypothetical protein